MTYKMLLSKAGRPMYYCDGKLIGAAKIPRHIFKAINDRPGIEVGEVEENINPDPVLSVPVSTQESFLTGKPCAVCGGESKLHRYLNLQTVYLCNEHYYSLSVGKLAAKLREMHSV